MAYLTVINAVMQQTVHQYIVLNATVFLSATEMGCVVPMWVTFKTVWVGTEKDPVAT